MRELRFAIKSFGCKVNQYEEQLLREKLKNSGFIEADIKDADIYIINSCTVTGQADKKAVRFVNRIKKENPSAKVYFTGCLAVTDEDILSLKGRPGIDFVIPNAVKMDIPSMLPGARSVGWEKNNTEGISGFESHARAFVKIQDGCDQKCAYCKVSAVRGPSRSRRASSIMTETERLVAKGYNEIVLTGICVGLWRGENGQTLAELMKHIAGIGGDFRIRLSSIEPNHITAGILDIFSSEPRICHHLHIPLQHGTDKILKVMNRKYTIGEFSALVENIRSKVPGIGISLDVIAGFPGETDSDFEESFKFVSDIRPSRLHVFQYSDRKGTAAYGMEEKVPQDVKKERTLRMIRAGVGMQKDFCREFVGRNITVLIEQKIKKGFLAGYSSEYVRVKLSGYDESIGNLVSVIPQDIDESDISLICSNNHK